MIKANTAKEIADISNMYIAPEVQLKVDSVFAEASTSIYHAARKGRHSTEIDEWALNRTSCLENYDVHDLRELILANKTKR